MSLVYCCIFASFSNQIYRMDSWYTKEDVIKDLALANGLGTNLDDDSVIISGARPPPPPSRHLDEDDEFQIRYGQFGDHNQSLKPDLKGITHMVRMVNHDEPPKKSQLSKKPAETSRILISKLNPFVPEFVPKLDRTVNNNTVLLSHEITTNGTIGDVSKELINSCEKEKSFLQIESKYGKEIKPDDTLDPCKNGKDNCINCELIDDEKVKCKALLKTKILETAKAKTIKEKSARNVAIAALLKLTSRPQQSPITTSSTNSSEETKISSHDSPVSADSNSSQKCTLVLHPPMYYESKCLHFLPNTTTRDVSSSCDEKTEQSEKEQMSPNLDSEEACPLDVSPEQDESHQKVLNWLNQPEKPKPHEGPHIGPINFKKRDTALHTGPILYQSKKKPPPKSPVLDSNKRPSQPPAFVPSQYASDLAKKFEERAKANEDRQLDMWSKLERDLKARDVVVKKRMKENNETNANASGGSSRCSSRRQ